MDSAMGYSMRKNKTYHRKKTVLLWVLCMGMMVGLAGRLVYLLSLIHISEPTRRS